MADFPIDQISCHGWVRSCCCQDCFTWATLYIFVDFFNFLGLETYLSVVEREIKRARETELEGGRDREREMECVRNPTLSRAGCISVDVHTFQCCV